MQQNQPDQQQQNSLAAAAATPTDDETLAQRKRRRVSFADVEITSVHIFNRDEDYETPPTDADPKPDERGEAGEVFSFLKDLEEREEAVGDEEEEDEEVGERGSFFRPVGSPSPGSSTARSVSSNDEEDFFGPVSASFIRPGRRVSDSAASDDNHDITMDSTAFSMHFRSLARSESGGDLKTPTGFSVGSEDKTPVNNASEEPVSGSSMVLTRAKKLLFAEPDADDKASGGYSGDMSLVGNDSQRYDYGKLSPTLEALLAEGRKDGYSGDMSLVGNDSQSYDSGKLSPTLEALLAEGRKDAPPAVVNNTSGLLDLKVSSDAEMKNTVDQNTSLNAFSEAPWKLHDAEGIFDVVQTRIQITKSNESSSYALDNVNATSKSPPKGDKMSDNLQVFVQSISQPKSLIEDHADGDSNKDNNVIPSKHLYVGSPYRSPSMASMSSSYAKTPQITDDIAMSSDHPIDMTPSPKLSGPLSGNMSDKQGGSMSSILKSISELKSVRSSPYVSSITAGSDRSRHGSSPLKDLSNHTSAPVVCLEDKLRNIYPSNKNHSWEPTADKSTDINRTDTSNINKSIDSLIQNEESQNLEKAGDALQSMHVEEIRKDKPTELTVMVSSPQSRMSAGKKAFPISSAENHCLTESGTESPSMDQKTEIRTGMDDKSVGSPAKRLHQKLATSNEHEGSLLGEKRLLSEADEDSRVVNKRLQIQNSGGHLISLVDKRDQSSPPRSYIKDLTKMTGVTDKVNNTAETIQTPLRRVTPLNFQFGSVDRNFQSGTGPSKSVEELRERLKSLPGGSVSSYMDKRRSIGQSVQESSYLEKQASSLTRKNSMLIPTIQNSHHALQSDKMLHHFGNFLNQNSKKPINDGQKATQISRSPNSVQHHVEEIKHSGKYPRTSSSSNINESGGSGFKFIQEQSIINDNRVETGAEAISKPLPDILAKATVSTEELLLPIVDKLDVKSIDMLEDTLDHLQRDKEFEMLCSGYQKPFNGISTIRHKRTAEAKMMFYKIIYENAKVQLLCAKRERLQKNIHEMHSANQECQSLKLKLGSEIQGSVKRKLADGCCSLSESQDEDSKKLTLLRQNIGGLEEDMMTLSKSFHNYLKLDGKSNSVDTLALAKDHLKKRLYHMLLRQILQLWEVDGFEVRNGHQSIVLNYLDFISRRFTIASGPTPSLSMSDKLNDDKMRKNFPNIDACTAFSFVMDSKNIERYFGSRRLMDAAHITGSVLQNLLNVLGEVQLAHLRVKGLIQASFHSPSDQQLDLQLCFADFTSGRQLAMTLDMTCLNRGTYPSEAIPYKMHERATETEKPVPSSLSGELAAAFQSLKAGYSRIIMLCRCVSQLLQSSSW